MNQDKPAPELSDEQIEKERADNAAYLADWNRDCGDILTQFLRADLGDILDDHAATVLPEVNKRLREWIAETRIENLAEWLDAKGWTAIEADAARAAEVEAALVKAAAGMQPISYVESYFQPGPLSWGAGKLAKWAKAFLNLPRNSPRPELGPEYKDMTLALGLDGLKALMTRRNWTPFTAGMMTWLRPLAAPWIEEHAKDETERLHREEKAVPIAIRPKARTDAGNEWTPLPRALDVAAALGGPFTVDVDGETYAPEPDIAGAAVGRALRPRGLDIVPADWLGNPAQLTLALGLDTPPEAVREYLGAVVETAARTAHLARLPNICPKLLGLMFAAAPMTGRMVQGTLGELARMLYPDWTSNRRSTRDLQGVGAAMIAVKGLRLVETEPDGTRRPYELFIVDMALTAKPDAVLGWTINPWLVKRMQGGKGGGFFLLNMTRWLALGIQNPRLFPLALRLFALQDEARKGGIYDPARLRWIEADRLAWECNTLPEGARMYRAGKTDAGTAKAALAAARANMEADLDALKKAGLALGPWKKRKVHGKGWTLLPVPTDDYPEACKKAVQATRKAKS